MDTMTDYRPIVRNLIAQYAQYNSSVGDIRTEAVCDEEKGHYALVHTGWNGVHRIDGMVLHIDIRDGKVWIEHNGTEDPIGTKLVEAGIPADHIVLGFKHPEIRPYTGFAVG
jgi:XisI protein